MLTLISTYSMFAKTGQESAHGFGVDVRTANENVTLAERHAG
jgi:hypothetical protein